MSKKHYSAFARPYTSILAALKKEQDEKFAAEHVSVNFDTALFPDYVFDLSDQELAPIPSAKHYKKSHAAKHRYVLDKPNTPYTPRRQNFFKELSLFLSPLLEDNPVVNDDFLTGYYLAKAFIIPNIIDNLPTGTAKILRSFHPGISSDGITKGMWYAFAGYNKKHNLDMIHWEFAGCDKHIKPQYKTKYLNGVAKRCDIFDINSIRSTSIQIEEKLGKLNFLVSDINPKSIRDTLSQLILSHDLMQPNGVVILRVMFDWLSQYTQMINLLIYCMSSYNVVKIFKTPWGLVPKLYLILSLPKRKALTAPHKTGLLKYYEALVVDTKAALYNKTIFNVEEKTEPVVTETTESTNDQTEDSDIPDKLSGESYMTQLKENLSEKYTQIATYDMQFTTPEKCSELWMTTVHDE